jgi:DNA uptake protein ComE-like DNA-binding protein
VNANTSPPEELTAALQLDENATNTLIARRAQRKFSGIDDLVTVPRVDKSVLQKLKTNLQF